MLFDIKKWVLPEKGKYCIKCTLRRCHEVGVDYTVGCCICYNDEMQDRQRQGNKDSTEISLCYECEVYDEFCKHSAWR